jgi:hypothetical protein
MVQVLLKTLLVWTKQFVWLLLMFTWGGQVNWIAPVEGIGFSGVNFI